MLQHAGTVRDAAAAAEAFPRDGGAARGRLALSCSLRKDDSCLAGISPAQYTFLEGTVATGLPSLTG